MFTFTDHDRDIAYGGETCLAVLGYVHLPIQAGGEELCRQLTAEQLVARAGRNGFRRLEWVKAR